MTEELLGYEQLSDFCKFLTREVWCNKRLMEQLIRTMDNEYDQQQREKKRK